MPAPNILRTSANRASQPARSTDPDESSGWHTLLQLTDPHLFADPQGQLLDVTTRRSFEAVLELALERSLPAEALVLTGDLVHDESPEGYRALRRLLDRTGLPYYCIPGNHDSHRLMKDLLGPAALAPIAVRTVGDWNLVFLDSTEPGRESGRLGQTRLVSLGELLAADSAPAVVFLHQHPIPVQSAWMDALGVEDGEDLLMVCDRHPQVKAVVCGHIHQEFAERHGALQILGTPSTCVQFKPRCADFAIDTRPPGYREIKLLENGRIHSQVIRLSGYPERASAAAAGY